MKSMTGYGRAEASKEGRQVAVEASSVNRRQLEVQVGLPRDLEALEARVRELIGRHVSRGRLSVRIVLQPGTGPDTAGVKVNRDLAVALVREFRQLGRDLQLEGELSVDALARIPGVVTLEETSPDAEAWWPSIQAALEPALERLVATRKKEGAHLAKELKHRIRLIQEAVRRIAGQAPEVKVRYRETLLQRIAEAGFDLVPELEERLAREIAVFAERSDITEELTRMESHLAQFEGYLKSEEPVGRPLDFLAQEMNREINTIGSKANDAAIAAEVVTLKSELEKFREQVQNVE